MIYNMHMLHSLNGKKYMFKSNIHHNSMTGLGLLVCEEGVPMRGHGHVLLLHVTCHLVKYQWR